MKWLPGCLLVLLCAGAYAEEPRRELIYGAELMTPQEREQYRREFSGAKDAPAQARVRAQQRQRLQERARERGVRLRDPEGVVQRERK